MMCFFFIVFFVVYFLYLVLIRRMQSSCRAHSVYTPTLKHAAYEDTIDNVLLGITSHGYDDFFRFFKKIYGFAANEEKAIGTPTPLQDINPNDLA